MATDMNYGTDYDNAPSGLNRLYNPCPNYIYFYHLSKVYYLPAYPADGITDSSSANFPTTEVLGRSAPIYAYSNSGPRKISFSFKFHREMMQKIFKKDYYSGLGDDYIDELVKAIQACVLPNYGASEKQIDPPIVAVRIDNEIFIKGVVGSCSVTYNKPILSNGKYALCDISFDVSEIEPWDAQSVVPAGSYRPVADAGNIAINTSLSRSSGSGVSSKNNRVMEVR